MSDINPVQRGRKLGTQNYSHLKLKETLGVVKKIPKVPRYVCGGNLKCAKTVVEAILKTVKRQKNLFI